MKAFLWHGIDYVTDNYHNGGSLLVVAASLDDVTEALATKGIPDECEAWALSPHVTFDLNGEYEPRVYLFPNAGCC